MVLGSALTSGGFLSGLTEFISYGLGMGLVLTVLTLGVALFGAAEIAGNTVPLGAGGTILPGTYGPAFVVVCPFSVPPADAPDIFASSWGGASPFAPIVVP